MLAAHVRIVTISGRVPMARISRITLGSSAGLTVVAALALAPVAAAQGEPPAPNCALVSVDEVNTVLGAQLTFNDNSSGYYCSIGAEAHLTISLLPETELEQMKADLSGGGEDVTVAGHPAWYQDSSGNFLVATNGSVLFFNGWSIAETSAEKLALMTALAELIVPRVPAGADPDVAARLTALLPATIGTEAVDVSIIPGWYLLGTDVAIRPEAQTVIDLLGTQGKATADLVVVAGVADSGSSAIVATVPGLEASTLLGPLFSAIVPTASTAPVSTVELGGKQVTRFELEPVIHAYASGDVAAYANGPDDFLASFFASLQ
jgi:hypothetical protein